MHTSITCGNVLCKIQTCPALPQSGRSVTEEEDEEEEDVCVCVCVCVCV